MRPSPAPVLALATLVAAPARGQDRSAVLVNFTGRTVQFTLDDPIGCKGTLRVAVNPAHPAPGPVWTHPDDKCPVTFDLDPKSQLQFSHVQPPGTEACWLFEFKVAFKDEAGPGDKAAPGALEGHLFLRTAPRWFFWGPDLTALSGAFYPTGRPCPLRVTKGGAWLLFLEPAEEAAPTQEP